MADQVVVAADVQPGTVAEGARTASAVAAEDITAGKAYRLDAAGKAHLATNDGIAEAAAVDGVALVSASEGQPMEGHLKGPFSPGFTAVAGEMYVLSADGGIKLHSERAAGELVTFIGYGMADGRINAMPTATGQVVPAA